MRTLQLACIITAIITGTVAITAFVLLLWPVLAGVAAAVCGLAVVGAGVADYVADRQWDQVCREEMAAYRREVWARRDREAGL